MEKFPLLKSKKKLKVLVIGYGSIGKKHCEILKKISSSIHVLTKQKVKNFNKIISLKKAKDLNPDYIVIASKTNTHFRFIKFIEKNFLNKKILIEKPIMEKYRPLQLRKNEYFVGYNLRFHPVILFLKKFILKKKINYIDINCLSYLPNWRKGIDYKKSNSAEKSGGGLLLELSHELDYVSWLFGRMHHIYSLNKKISNLKISTDDILIFIGKNYKNSIVHIAMNFFSRLHKREIIIEGNNFSCKADIFNNKVLVINDKKKKIYNFPKNIKATYFKQHLAILNGKKKSLCTVDSALSTLKEIKKIKSFK